MAIPDKFKPMKASSTTVEELPIPCYVGTKYDGIRAVVIDSKVYSLSLKLIRNWRIQEKYGKPEYNGLDGELVVGDIYAPDVFNKTTSIVMAQDKEIDDVKFYIFDDFTNPDDTYETRKIHGRLKLVNNPLEGLVDAFATLCFSREAIQAKMDEQADLGGEGLIARKVGCRYKYGRSSVREGYLLKLKFYEQKEFKVVGFTEQMHNANEAVINGLGRTSRSSAQDGLVPKDTLGALELELDAEKTFHCGTGFSDEDRQEIWNNQTKYLHKWASIRYMKTGIKDLPRHPVFVGFRDEDDMTE